ncbi:LuxR C-terminal-related transcriptional regulator [Dactylosporangium cerinum]|uniref:LuxR C-terminal-related transcriptional regulator n=1 Tax=Dactylosporangium cerinum TaxID=1434730 RepID=A0ABV9W9M7_9ACTN
MLDDPAVGAVTMPAAKRLYRPRLHRALDRADQHGVTTVLAPAGAGKTELATVWLRTVPAPHRTAYVQVAQCPDGRWWCPAALPARWWPAGATTFEDWLDQLRQQGGGATPCTVVLDGAETAAPGVLAQLDRLVTALPVHVVLCGRHAPAPADSAPGGESLFPALNGADLAFTPAETADLCDRHHLMLRPATIRRLCAVTEGWAAGVVVAIAALAGEPHNPDTVLDRLERTGAGLHEYVQNEVLAELPADVADAVQASSIVETVNPELFTALTGRTDSADILADLARNDMFAYRLNPASPWYRYRRLWRAAIVTALHEQDPATARELHRRAASWYGLHHQPAEALRHAIAGQGPTLTAAASPPTATGRAVIGTGVPAGIAEAWLALSHGRPDLAQAAIDATGAGPALPTGDAPDTAQLRVRAVIAFQRGHLRKAARHADRIRAVLHEHGITGAEDEGWALLVLAGVAIARGRAKQAHRHLYRLAAELRQPDPQIVAGERFHTALLEHQQGRHATALRHVERLITDGVDTLVIPCWAPRALRIDALLAIDLSSDARRHWNHDARVLPPVVADLIAAKLLLLEETTPEVRRRIDRRLQPHLQNPPASLLHDIEVRLILAADAYRHGDAAHAVHLERQAAALAAAEDIHHPRFLDPRRPHGPRPAAPQHPEAHTVPLTAAETAVCELLQGFLTVTEIADALKVSPNTVKTHMSGIYRKLGVHRRRDAVRRARELGLF